jgi:hypothetical protein
MHDHGWIDTPDGGHVVCPGDWVITGVNGEHYPCKPDVFEATYEEVTQPQQAREAPTPEATSTKPKRPRMTYRYSHLPPNRRKR